MSTKQLKIETCSQPEATCSSLADLSQQGSSAGFGFAKCHIRVGKLIGFCFNRTRFNREAPKNRISSEVFPRWRLLSLCSSGTQKVVQFRPSRQHPLFSDFGQFYIIPVTRVKWHWREQQNHAIPLHKLSGKTIQYRGSYGCHSLPGMGDQGGQWASGKEKDRTPKTAKRRLLDNITECSQKHC